MKRVIAWRVTDGGITFIILSTKRPEIRLRNVLSTKRPTPLAATRIGRHFHCYYYFSTSFSKELQIYHIRWCLWCKPPGNLVCPTDVIWFRSHSSDCRKMAEYMVRHSSVSLSVITFSTQNILELYFGRWKVIFWLIIGALFIVTVAFRFNCSLKGHA